MCDSCECEACATDACWQCLAPPLCDDAVQDANAWFCDDACLEAWHLGALDD